MIIEKNVWVQMRDGTRLATDVYRPDQDGPVPVLLTRLPYNKEAEWFRWIPLDQALAAGYAYVIQDTRGRYASEGEYARPFIGDAEDGADTIAWLAQQPWCSGRVGMFGLSAQGITQLLAASERPPALRAIAPMFCPPRIDSQQYQGGALRLGTFLEWAYGSGAMGEAERRVSQGRATPAALAALQQADRDNMSFFRRTPLSDQPLLREYAPYFLDWLKPQTEAETLAARQAIYDGVSAPALHIGGWYDLFIQETLANYQALRHKEQAGQAGPQRLLIGPWAHLEFPGVFPDHDYGPQGSTTGAQVVGRQLAWFDRWLKDRAEADTADAEQPVRLFIMGADVWRDEADWPLPDTQYRRYYLHSQGQANTAAGDGRLTDSAPGDEPADSYVYDPRQPAPTTGGANMLLYQNGALGRPALNAGPRDQRLVEQRPDVLCYSTPALQQPLEVTGPIRLVLFAESSAPSTDFTGKLVDVYPDGRTEILCDGIVRAGPLTPGHAAELKLDLGATANVFQAGHRLRLEVSSSNFPRFDRNPNTGGVIAETREADYRTAENTVRHAAGQASYLVLPVIER